MKYLLLPSLLVTEIIGEQILLPIRALTSSPTSSCELDFVYAAASWLHCKNDLGTRRVTQALFMWLVDPIHSSEDTKWNWAGVRGSSLKGASLQNFMCLVSISPKGGSITLCCFFIVNLDPWMNKIIFWKQIYSHVYYMSPNSPPSPQTVHFFTIIFRFYIGQHS